MTAAAAAALCMSAMVSERSESEDVDEAVEDPVEDEMEDRCDDDADADAGEAFENTCNGMNKSIFLIEESIDWRQKIKFVRVLTN